MSARVFGARGIAVASCVVALLMATAACSNDNTRTPASSPQQTTAPSAGSPGGGAPPVTSLSEAEPAAAAVAGAGVTPMSVPSTVHPGQRVTFSLQTRPGTTCQILFEGSGYKGPPLPPAVADADGHVSWSWKLSDQLKPGPATVRAVCSGGATGAANLTVT